MNKYVEEAKEIVRKRSRVLRDHVLPELGMHGMTKDEAILLVLAELLERDYEKGSEQDSSD